MQNTVYPPGNPKNFAFAVCLWPILSRRATDEGLPANVCLSLFARLSCPSLAAL